MTSAVPLPFCLLHRVAVRILVGTWPEAVFLLEVTRLWGCSGTFPLVVSHTWSIWNANNAKIKNWFVIHDFPMDPNETGSSRIKIAWKLFISLLKKVPKDPVRRLPLIVSIATWKPVSRFFVKFGLQTSLGESVAALPSCMFRNLFWYQIVEGACWTCWQ
jgi:hypothetical protein